MFTTSHLHPMLVHFPIAIIAVGFVGECASMIFKKEACLSKAGFYLLLLGTLAVVAAIFSGALFTGEMTGAAGAIKETHESFAWTSLYLILALSGLRIYLRVKNKEESAWKWAAFSLYGLAMISISITGYFGGTLVYDYMMPL